MCLARAGWEVLRVRGFGLGFTIPEGTGGKWDLCFGCSGVDDVGVSGWVAWARVWEGGVVLNLCEL